MFRKIALLSAVALGLGGGAASAQEAPKPFYIHVGPAGVLFDMSAKLTAAGQPMTGASISGNNAVTPAVEVGYYVSRNFAVSFTGGYPPTMNVQAAGSLQGAGQIGKAVFGPMSLTAHYHFTNFGRFRPYIGGGAVFMHVFSTTDGLLTDLQVHDHFGYAGQIGADYLINDKWGAFIDFKKAHLHTTSTGNLGPVPISGDVTLNPAVIHGGIAYRF